MEDHTPVDAGILEIETRIKNRRQRLDGVENLVILSVREWEWMVAKLTEEVSDD